VFDKRWDNLGVKTGGPSECGGGINSRKGVRVWPHTRGAGLLGEERGVTYVITGGAKQVGVSATRKGWCASPLCGRGGNNARRDYSVEEV